MRIPLPAIYVVTISFLGCGGGASPRYFFPDDGGGGHGGGSDLGSVGVPDMGTSPGDFAVATFDLSSPPDLTASPYLGTQIAAGAFYVGGVTSDGQVLAFPTTGTKLLAVPIGGGGQQTVDANASQFSVKGKLVFTSDNVDTMTNVGSLSVWSAMNGSKSLSAASVAGFYDATADNQYIFYTDNAATDGSATDLIVARADGGNPRKVVSQAQVSTDCSPNERFVGDKLYLLYCAVPGDGGTSTANAVVFDALSGQLTTLKTGLATSPFSVDKNGVRVFVADQNGIGWVLSTQGGGPIQIDTGVKDGWILPDGATVVYRNGNGALRRAPINNNPNPFTLVGSGVNNLLYYVIQENTYPAMSPDGRWLVYATTLNMMTGLSDLHLATTQAATNPVQLAGASGALFGDAFTSDSLRALFYANCVDNAQIMGLIGTYEAQAVGGGNPTQFGSQSWIGYAGQGTRVVYNANLKSNKFHGRADLFVADTKGGNPTLIAPQAESDFYLTWTRDIAVYAINGVGQAGLYAYSIP